MKTYRSKPNFIAKPPARVQAMAKKYGTLGIVKNDPYGQNEAINGDFDSAVDWDVGTNWSIANSKATHVAGSNGGLYQTIPTISVGSEYQITVVASGVTAGQLRIYLGDTATITGTVTTNGEHSFIGTMETSYRAISFWGLDTFAGSIESVVLRKVL